MERPLYNALRYALAIAKHGSYRRAAQSLGVSQPQLSRRIQTLEHDLGCALFERDRQGVTVTTEGEHILREAVKLLDADDAFRASIAKLRRASESELRLCAGAFVSQSWLPTAIAAFTEDHPAVSISMREIDWWQLADAAVDGDCHLALGETSEAERRPDITVERFPERPGSAFVRRGHRLAGRETLSIEDFAHLQLAAPRLPGRVSSFMPTDSRLGSLSADGRFFVPTIESATPRSMIDVVAASDAVCLMPRGLCAPQVTSGQMVELPFHPPWLTIRQGIIYASGRRLPESALAFRSYAKVAERNYARI